MSKGILNKFRALPAVGIFGGVVGAIAGGITLALGGPAAIVAGATAAVFGLFGCAVSALNDGTNGRGDDYRETWAVGLPATALLAYGAYALFGSAQPQTPPPQPPAVSMIFNQASPASAREIPAAQWVHAAQAPKIAALG